MYGTFHSQLAGAALDGGLIRIRYRNRCGEVSEREVRPQRTWIAYGNGYVRAYCNLAHEVRTFRIDRILACERGGAAAVAFPSVIGAAVTLPRVATPPPPPAARVAPALPAAAGPARSRLRFGDAVLGTLLTVFVGALIVGGLADGDAPFSFLADLFDGPSTQRIRYTPPAPSFSVAQAKAYAGARAADTRPTASRPATSRATYHYRTIPIVQANHGASRTYSAPTFAVTANTKRELHLVLNAILFRKATAITDYRLESMYAAADRDRDGYLIWNEIRAFQQWLHSTFEYQTNATALRPDQFLAAGGGDCEDWALVTAGLLRFWGWEAFIATFVLGDGSPGHAVSLVPWPEKPPGFDSYALSGRVTSDRKPLPNAHYVPIDYQIVGGSSSAMQPWWHLTTVYVPERMYGRFL